MTDEDIEKIRIVMREVVAPIEATLAEHSRQIALLIRSAAVLQQDVTKIRNSHIGQEVILDDVQDQTRKIALALDDLRRPAVKPIGEGGIAEIRQLYSELNSLQRKTAELQGRLEILEGRREG